MNRVQRMVPKGRTVRVSFGTTSASKKRLRAASLEQTIRELVSDNSMMANRWKAASEAEPVCYKIRWPRDHKKEIEVTVD